MSEPGTGSDVAAIATRAKRVNGGYVVNGAKTFISNGLNADLVVTAVRTEETGHRGLSILVIEEGMPGFTRGRNLEKLGTHAADTAELFFEDVEVPVENLLGEEGQGFRYLMQQPGPGAARDRDHGGGGRAGRARTHAGVREGASRVRPAGRDVPELALQARRVPRRDAGHAGARRQRAWRATSPAS